jgi:hypothetical protein
MQGVRRELGDYVQGESEFADNQPWLVGHALVG